MTMLEQVGTCWGRCPLVAGWLVHLSLGESLSWRQRRRLPSLGHLLSFSHILHPVRWQILSALPSKYYPRPRPFCPPVPVSPSPNHSHLSLEGPTAAPCFLLHSGLVSAQWPKGSCSGPLTSAHRAELTMAYRPFLRDASTTPPPPVTSAPTVSPLPPAPLASCHSPNAHVIPSSSQALPGWTFLPGCMAPPLTPPLLCVTSSEGPPNLRHPLSSQSSLLPVIILSVCVFYFFLYFPHWSNIRSMRARSLQICSLLHPGAENRSEEVLSVC